jgi:hypothetical protein
MRFYSIIKHDLISKKYFYLDYGGGIFYTHVCIRQSIPDPDRSDRVLNFE